jgi:hypothetical protein
MSQSMVGDGCRYCQPQEHIDRLSEWLEEAQAESDKLTVIVAECRDAGGFGDPYRDGVEGWAALGDPAEVPNFIEKAFTKLTQERDALVEILRDCTSKLESQVCRNPELPPSYKDLVARSFSLLANIDKGK